MYSVQIFLKMNILDRPRRFYWYYLMTHIYCYRQNEKRIATL